MAIQAGQELDLQVHSYNDGAALTSQGHDLYERARVVRPVLIVLKIISQCFWKGNQHSIASQHYDATFDYDFLERYPDYKDFRIFESTTIQILRWNCKGPDELWSTKNEPRLACA